MQGCGYAKEGQIQIFILSASAVTDAPMVGATLALLGRARQRCKAVDMRRRGISEYSYFCFGSNGGAMLALERAVGVSRVCAIECIAGGGAHHSRSRG